MRTGIQMARTVAIPPRLSQLVVAARVIAEQRMEQQRASVLQLRHGSLGERAVTITGEARP